MDVEEVEQIATRRRAALAGSLIFAGVSTAVSFLGVSLVGAVLLVYGARTGAGFAMSWGPRLIGLAVPVGMGFGLFGLTLSRRVAVGRGSLAAHREDGWRAMVPYGLALGPSAILASLLVVPVVGGVVAGPHVWWVLLGLAGLSVGLGLLGSMLSRRGGGVPAAVMTVARLLWLLGLWVILIGSMWPGDLWLSLAGVAIVVGALAVKATVVPRLLLVWTLRPMLAADYDRALARARWTSFGALLRVYVLVDADRLELAELELEPILASVHGRSKAQLLHLRGMIERRRGDRDRASATFREALDIGPETGLLWSMAEQALERGDASRGLELVDAAEACVSGSWEQMLLASDPRVSLAAVRAWAYAVAGDQRASRTAIARVEEALPRLGAHPRALALWHLGLAEQVLDDDRAAVARWTQSAALDREGRVGHRAKEALAVLAVGSAE